MGGPNEREIGLCMWKQIGTFCCFNWSRHCINIPQAKYLFSVHSQIEPSIIIVYPWVRTSPKRRFLFSGWPGCSFHYIAKNVNTQVLLGLRSVMFVRTPMCLDLLCPFEKEIWKPADHEVNFFLLIIIIIFSLLCFDNKLPVINESLYSPALDKEKKEQKQRTKQKMREICLCWRQPSTLQGSAAVWVIPREREQDGCERHWWPLFQHDKKVRNWTFPFTLSSYMFI